MHLAAVVSSAAEADFDLGMEVNLQSTLKLLDACHRPEKPPVVIFSSSVAVFSCADNETIQDTCLPEPQSSYGSQKLIGELLVRDATRKGFINGRSLRFPTISVRPGKPNLAASSFASGIIREPLAGLPSTLPVGQGLRLHLASPRVALKAMLHAISLQQDPLNGETTITLPGISVTVAEMVEALARVAGAQVAALIKHAPDPNIEAIVASWPGKIVTPRALALGFQADAGFDDLILHHMKAVD